MLAVVEAVEPPCVGAIEPNPEDAGAGGGVLLVGKRQDLLEATVARWTNTIWPS